MTFYVCEKGKLSPYTELNINSCFITPQNAKEKVAKAYPGVEGGKE